MTVETCKTLATIGLPAWVPAHVRHYLAHTEAGLSIRALARRAGCHASTVLRQVRRNETRRDDPLVDTALSRLARAARAARFSNCEDIQQMKMETRFHGSELPDDTRLDAEARRILRRLAEPSAVLAVAPGMEKAVVVRETADGRSLRTAVVDAGIAEAFALKDWIEGETRGRIARYRLTPAGRAALKRLLGAEAPGTPETPSVFGDQHRDYAGDEGGRRGRRARYNANESPLTALARRRDKDGAPFLDAGLVQAGERLREDFELAQMGPRVAQNWDRFLTGGDRGGVPVQTGGRGPEGARARVTSALKDLGPGLGDVALRCCCFLEGMEQAEKRMGWSARSGKIVLKIALQRLRRHYDGLGREAQMIG
jgi:lambda repressor-like predicted transcriptional regulator/DNA-binding PadR family transcriptional regulator